ncbi:hypothetical protein [Roseateles sp. PN1]|uniref:hypothetical protein n=1 Tax=Roseateles sp. PN1 TaxID=3137372 RepID=UPI003138C48E
MKHESSSFAIGIKNQVVSQEGTYEIYAAIKAQAEAQAMSQSRPRNTMNFSESRKSGNLTVIRSEDEKANVEPIDKVARRTINYKI